MEEGRVKLIDLTGQRFGRLTVVSRGDQDAGGRATWNVLCDCGTRRQVAGYSLRAGLSKSCGCLQALLRAEARPLTTEYAAEYSTWLQMRGRCSNPKATHFARYGGRGIRVCERWAEFEAFLADMGPRPSASHSIDRIDNDGNYEPGNCRWATDCEQANNQSRNVRVTIEGVTKTVAEWAATSPVSAAAIYRRIVVGWAPERAVNGPRVKMRVPDDVRKAIVERYRLGGVRRQDLAAEYGVPLGTVHGIIRMARRVG